MVLLNTATEIQKIPTHSLSLAQRFHSRISQKFLKALTSYFIVFVNYQSTPTFTELWMVDWMVVMDDWLRADGIIVASLVLGEGIRWSMDNGGGAGNIYGLKSAMVSGIGCLLVGWVYLEFSTKSYVVDWVINGVCMYNLLNRRILLTEY